MNNTLSQQAAVLALKCKARQFRNEAGDQSIPSMLLDKWIFQHLVRNRYGVQRYSPIMSGTAGANVMRRPPSTPR